MDYYEQPALGIIPIQGYQGIFCDFCYEPADYCLVRMSGDWEDEDGMTVEAYACREHAEKMNYNPTLER